MELHKLFAIGDLLFKADQDDFKKKVHRTKFGQLDSQISDMHLDDIEETRALLNKRAAPPTLDEIANAGYAVEMPQQMRQQELKQLVSQNPGLREDIFEGMQMGEALRAEVDTGNITLPELEQSLEGGELDG